LRLCAIILNQRGFGRKQAYLIRIERGGQLVPVGISQLVQTQVMAEQLQRIGNNLWAQRMDLEKREATSFMWASFGAKRMQERRREKPLLENERDLLDAEMQPPLFQIVGGTNIKPH